MTNIRLAQYAGHIFIVRTAMTQAQVRIVQESFQRLEPQAARASGLFYAELFRLSPELRQLFPEDMARQQRKFVKMLSAIVGSLDKIESISREVVELGRRHEAYDVTAEHFANVGEALMAMLEQLLGAQPGTELEEAWAAAYEMLARVMQDAAVAPYDAEGFFGAIIRGVMASQYGLPVAARIGKPGKASISRNVERGQMLHSP